MYSVGLEKKGNKNLQSKVTRLLLVEWERCCPRRRQLLADVVDVARGSSGGTIREGLTSHGSSCFGESLNFVKKHFSKFQQT